jgi:hypothetical protein
MPYLGIRPLLLVAFDGLCGRRSRRRGGVVSATPHDGEAAVVVMMWAGGLCGRVACRIGKF